MKITTLFSKNIIIAIVLLVIVITALLLPRDQEVHIAEPTAVQGVLDLTDWDFETNGIVDLKGEWEFYWNQLLTSPDIADGAMSAEVQLVQVPNVWTDYKVDGKFYPGEGYSTYRLQVQMSGEAHKLGLKIPDMSTACRIMINGE